MGPDIIYRYFPNLTSLQQQQIEQLLPLYQDWNEKINVISRKDIDLLYERHVLHSLAIAKFIQFVPGTQVLDLGTGGGFPGIPLAILYPEVSFHLVDSIQKKITVVSAVAESLQLVNVGAEHQRAEKVKGNFDFVVSRAVARTKQLFIWTHQKIKAENRNAVDNGMILLKGGDLEAELKEHGRAYAQTALSDYYQEDFFTTKSLVYLPR